MKMLISDIKVNWTDNSRGALQKEQVDSLADSLARDGLINPVTVIKLEDGSTLLRAGYTRLAAAIQLGWTEIDVSYYEGDGTVVNWVENIRRSNPSMYQEALSLKAWRDKENVGYREIASKMGVSMNWIMTRLRLLELDEETKRLADGPKGSITAVEINKRFNQVFRPAPDRDIPRVDSIVRAPAVKKESRPRLTSEIQDAARQLVDKGIFGPALVALNWVCGYASNADLKEALDIDAD